MGQSAAADFKPAPLARGGRVGLGTLVEVEDGDAGKRLFVAPAGADEELTGPDGDGFLNVNRPRPSARRSSAEGSATSSR